MCRPRELREAAELGARGAKAEVLGGEVASEHARAVQPVLDPGAAHAHAPDVEEAGGAGESALGRIHAIESAAGRFGHAPVRMHAVVQELHFRAALPSCRILLRYPVQHAGVAAHGQPPFEAQIEVVEALAADEVHPRPLWKRAERVAFKRPALRWEVRPLIAPPGGQLEVEVKLRQWTRRLRLGLFGGPPAHLVVAPCRRVARAGKPGG